MPDDGLTGSWERLRALLSRPDWEGDDAWRLLRALGAAAHGAPPDENARTCAAMGAFIRTAGIQEAGLVALAGGALVEHGGPVEPLAPAIRARWTAVLSAAERFAVAARAAFPETDEDQEEMPDAVWVGTVQVPREWAQEFAERDREAATAYLGLENWCRPMMAMALRERPLLEELAADDSFRGALGPVADANQSAGWLARLCQVPLDETFVFVDARAGRVFEVKVDGVASNFELHTLLAAALAAPLGHPPPLKAVLDCLAGRGPQTTEAPSEGLWNLYTWHAAAVPGTSLRAAPHSLWIWGEGEPVDIPRFENRRVVLAGEPSYPRSWTTSRTYDALHPRVELLRELPPDDARALLARLRAEAATLGPAPAEPALTPDPAPRMEVEPTTRVGRLLARIGWKRKR